MNECAVYVDMGTTNTRVWLVEAEQVLASARKSIGVRDTARGGSSAQLRRGLGELISDLQVEARRTDHTSCSPSCIVAAGMITSPLGLVEVPHIAAPAGLDELAAGVERHCFPDITDLPFLLVPGVRTGPATFSAEMVAATDVMRGEETLCMGLMKLGLLKPGGMLLNLGSHWKVIRLDAAGRIASSITSMSGELLHAAQTQTILASAVPHERPSVIDDGWMQAGMREQRASGLARALFCVRLLEQGSREATPDERLAYLIGAFIASDMDALIKRRIFTADAPIVITGSGGVAAAWQRALLEASIPAATLTEREVERALLTGLRCIAAASTANTNGQLGDLTRI